MTGSNDMTDPSAAGATPQRLGDLLLAGRLVTEAQLREAEDESAKTGEFLCKLLVQKEFITQDDINACFVKLCKIPHISLLDYDVGSDVLQLIPQEICLTYGLLPIDKLGRILTVAMVDPLDFNALTLIREHCPELRIKPILCNWTHFEQVSKKYFSASSKKASGEGESMASFGLSSLPPKPAAKPAAPAAPTRPIPAAPIAGGSPVDTQALVAAIQEGLRGVIQELAARPSTTAPTTAPESAPAQFSPELFAETMRASIRDALTEGLQALPRTDAPPLPAAMPAPDWSGLETAFKTALDDLKDSMRQIAPPAPAVAAPAPTGMPAGSSATDVAIQELIGTLKNQPPPGEILGELVRDTIGGAIQEAMASVLVQMRAAQKPEPEALSMEALAETIRDSLGGAMQEVMATIIVQLRSNTGQSEDAATQQEAMVAALRDFSEASRQALEDQGARLTALAEAAVQTTQQTSQLVEASLVQNERANNLRKNKRDQHASVSPFGSLPPEGGAAVHTEEDERVRDALDAEIPLETLTFNTFFPGKSNAFTVQIGQSVAQSPGGEYNPFFLFGNVGLGKTHLISAVGNHIQKTHPGHRVGYVSASHFSRRLKEALSADAQDAFRENYCHWDVLILDDIQFMGGRVEAQEEFFHIFNVLHQQGRQIVIASDKAPDRLGLLEQRLVSRFSSGIVAELKPPEWETRMQILKHHVAAAKANVPEEICSLIAMRVASDIRKMVGSLRKIIAFTALSKETMTVELATEILSHIGGEEAA